MLLSKFEIDISPDPGRDLCGFANRPQPSAEIADRLFCKGILLITESQKLMFVQFDLIGLSSSTSDAFRRNLADVMGMQPSDIQVFCSHTHSGPCTLPLLGCGEYNNQYVDWLLQDLPSKIGAHLNQVKVEPVYPSLLSAEGNLGRHRRGFEKSKHAKLIGCLAFFDAYTEPQAIIVTYSMHPVGLKGDRISRDYPGFLADFVQSQLPGNPTVLFGLAPSGDIDPPAVGVNKKTVQDWAHVLGRSLVSQLKSQMNFDRASVRKMPTPDIRIKQIDLPWKVHSQRNEIEKLKSDLVMNQAAIEEFGDQYLSILNNWYQNRINQLSLAREFFLPLKISLIEIAEFRIVLINAEVFSSILNYIQIERDLVITLGNGSEGYLPDLQQYPVGGYEVDESFVFYDQFKPYPGSLEALGRLISEN